MKTWILFGKYLHLYFLKYVDSCRDFLDKKQNYLLKKSASERSQHEQTLAVAKKDLEDFYTDHNKKIAHKLKENQYCLK